MRRNITSCPQLDELPLHGDYVVVSFEMKLSGSPVTTGGTCDGVLQQPFLPFSSLCKAAPITRQQEQTPDSLAMIAREVTPTRLPAHCKCSSTLCS